MKSTVSTVFQESSYYFTGVFGELFFGGAVVDVGNAYADDGRGAHSDEETGHHEYSKILSHRGPAARTTATGARRRLVLTGGGA